jgi:thioredoxin-like negative regulator of GroEL
MGESMAGKISEIGAEEFNNLLKSEGRLLVVEFYTSTCPVCGAMAPIYQAVADELAGKAEFTKMNAQTNSSIASRFGIMGVPAFKFFCNGKEIGGIVGQTNATALGNTVKDFIRHGPGCKSTALFHEMDGYG